MSTADQKETKDEQVNDEDLADYEDDDVEQEVSEKPKAKKGTYAGIHATGFKDFVLKAEILQALSDCSFESPSQVQQVCIPQAIQGHDVICQEKAGMGKTAIFVLSTLHLIRPEKDENGKNIIDTLALVPARELAHQINKEFKRFGVYMEGIESEEIYGGTSIREHRTLFKEKPPHIVAGTPGRVKALVKEGSMKIDKLKRFILDECDRLLAETDMRAQVQEIFMEAPYEKQVMMFSATISKDVLPVCRKMCTNPQEFLVEAENKLTLRSLSQYYVKLDEKEKNRKLTDLLDKLKWNQVVIFVNSTRRCKDLNMLLNEVNFPSMAMMGAMKQTERIDLYNKFKRGDKRLLVSTDVFARGVDFAGVDLVINYDMPESDDTYLHRVGRSGRYDTKGTAITFLSSETDSEVHAKIQSRFEVAVNELPDELDMSA